MDLQETASSSWVPDFLVSVKILPLNCEGQFLTWQLVHAGLIEAVPNCDQLRGLLRDQLPTELTSLAHSLRVL